MNIAVYVLAVAGAFVTFASKVIAEAILSGRREPNEADIVYIKLVGFALILAAAIIAFK